MHAKFGPGKIISRSGLGMDAKVVVFFKKRGQKKLMLRAAPSGYRLERRFYNSFYVEKNLT